MPPTGRPTASAASRPFAREGTLPTPGPEERRSALFEHDLDLDQPWVVGADEAGRGCLAGPIVGAAIALDHSCLSTRGGGLLDGIDDSKRLTEKRREELFPRVMAAAGRVSVTVRSARFIDMEGIQKANLECLAESVARAASGLDAVSLVDGFALPEDAPSHRRLVKGDATSAAIAAASVVAKVVRDRCMQSLADRHPGYGFEGHKGYGSAAHREAIAELGPSPVHRLSFRLTDSE